MNNNLKLVAGGIAGIVLPLALVAGVLAWAESSSPGGERSAAAPAPPRSVEPAVPSPRLDSELATTRGVAAPPEPVAPADPEPGPAPDPYRVERASNGPVEVRRLIVSTGVSGHEPTGARDVFVLGSTRRIYAFVDAANRTGEPVALQVTFERRGAPSTGHVSLDVPAGARRWRTWAYTRHVYEPGRWSAVVRGPAGRVLARRAFDVEE